jgi:hypothetical protein
VRTEYVRSFFDTCRFILVVYDRVKITEEDISTLWPGSIPTTIGLAAFAT